MGSIHDWLAFSLSPHLAGVDLQGETCHALNAAAAAAAYELPSNTSHYLSAPEAQGSLCILEAFNRGAWTNRSATEIKPDTQAQADSEPAQQQQHQLINADFSALQGSNSSDLTSDSTTININIRQRPKLENFLGGAEVQHQQQQENPAAQHHHHQMFFSNGEALQVQSLCMSESSDSSKQPEQHQQESMAMAADFYSLQHLPQSSVYNMYGMSPAAGVFKTWLPSQSSSSEDSVVPSAAGSAPMAVPIQPLSLSVSGSSESKCSPSAATSAAIVAVSQNSPQENPSSGVSTHNNQSPVAPLESTPRKSIDTFGQRTSIYRGVTKHRWTGRYEAHLWDNSCRREGQTRKGRQVYLGGYDKEEKAARAYDLAALKYWGPSTTTNFAISTYEKELEEMKHMTRQEFVASLRRKSSGFSRGASIYRGVTRHHQHGRWQARIGRVAGNKDLYLGTFSTQEEAAEAYDIAAIKFRGLNAVTNFDISRYDVKSIANSALPIGGIAKRLKDAEPAVKRMIATADTITAAAVAAATHNQQQQSNCKTHHHDQEWVSLANPLSMAATTSLSWLKNQPDLYNNSSHIHHHTATASNLHNNNSTALLFGDSASVAEASKSTYDNILYYLSQQQQQQQSQSHTRQVAAEYEALSWLPSTTVMATSSAAHQAARAANLPPLFSIWNES